MPSAGAIPIRSVPWLRCTAHYRRGDWDARVETELVMTSDKTHFHMEGTVRTFDGGKPFIARDFKRSFKRDNVCSAAVIYGKFDRGWSTVQSSHSSFSQRARNTQGG